MAANNTTPSDGETFRLTQPLIVALVVVGGVFLTLVVINLVLAFLLWTNTGNKSKRRHPARRADSVSGNKTPDPDQKSSRGSFGGAWRAVYRRQSNAKSGSGDERLAFQSFGTGAADNSESDEAADDGWLVAPLYVQWLQHNSYKMAHRRKWEAILSVRSAQTDANIKLDLTKDSKINSGHEKLRQESNVPNVCNAVPARREINVHSTPSTQFSNDYTFASDPPRAHEISARKNGTFGETSITKDEQLLTDHQRSYGRPSQPEELLKRSYLFRSNSESKETSGKLKIDSPLTENTCEVDFPIKPVIIHSDIEAVTVSQISHAELTYLPNAQRLEIEHRVPPGQSEYHVQTKFNAPAKEDEEQHDDVINDVIIPQFPALIDTQVTPSPGKGLGKQGKSKSPRPGKLFKKKHECVSKSAKYRANSATRLSASPPLPKYSPIPVKKEIISERGEEEEGESNDASSLDSMLFKDSNGMCTRLTDVETNNGMKAGLEKSGNIQKERLRVDTRVFASANYSTTVSYPTTVSHPKPRSPILDWSISDDAKQSYFSQNILASSSLEEINTEQSSSSPPPAVVKAVTCGNSLGDTLPNDGPESSDARSHLGLQLRPLARPKNSEYSPDAYPQREFNKNTPHNGPDNDVFKVRLMKTPTRRGSFVHRLLNRSKGMNNEQHHHILKTSHSENTLGGVYQLAANRYKTEFRTNLQTRSELPTTGMNYRKYQHMAPNRQSDIKTQKCKNQNIHLRQPNVMPSRQRGLFKNEYNMNISLPFEAPRFTLSEEDLCMYPDSSIPTIDELVENGTNRRKRAGRRKTRQRCGNVTKKLSTSDITVKSSELALAISHNQELTSTLGVHTGVPTSSMYKHRYPSGGDDGLLGFHTGVSDKYHSIGGRTASALGQMSVQHRLDIMALKDLEEPRNVPKTPAADIDSGAKAVAIASSLAPAKNDDEDDGNWNISVLTQRTDYESREVDSVSSFALSDFDMGESDVDDVSKGDNDNGDEEGGVSKNAIHDVHL